MINRLARLISCIQYTSGYRQHCHVGNTASPRKLGMFQGADFAGDMADSKSTSGGVLCIFGSLFQLGGLIKTDCCIPQQ